MDEIKEIKDHFNSEIKVVKVEIPNGEKIIKKYIIYNFLGMFISNVTVASFLLWNNKENINYYLVDDEHMCFFINEIFYKIKVEITNKNTLKYKNKEYTYVNC